MVRIKQKFNTIPGIVNIEKEVKRQIAIANVMSTIKAGDKIAITAGSRGIANMDRIIRSIVNEIKFIGAIPFIVPAMGSHGNAVAEGQIEVLRHYNITEESMGCPIRSSMDTVELGEDADGIPVYIDKNAYSADKIVVLNRIKQHTDFSGKIESGLVKMLAIGLGKQKGASTYHKASLKFGFERVLRNVAEKVLSTGKIAFGFGIVENQYDQTAILQAMSAEDLIKTEENLQEKAKQLSACLPFDIFDVLIVDEIGKDISGLGMDTKVIGRMMQTGESDPEKPKITRIVALDLTPNTMGNAAGIGLADFTTKRLVDKIDFGPTYMNFITSLGPQKVRIPINFEDDRKVLDAVFNTIGLIKSEDSRVVRIKNTLKLDEVDISEALLDEIQKRDDLEIVGKPKDFEFTDDNILKTFDFREEK
jgi:hypothetical protein